MKKLFNLVEFDRNDERFETVATGTKTELFEEIKSNADSYFGWISDNEPEKYNELTQAIKKTETLDEIEEIINEYMDYDWYKNLIVTDDEFEEIKEEYLG